MDNSNDAAEKAPEQKSAPQITNNISVAGSENSGKKSNSAIIIVLVAIIAVLGVLVALFATGVIGGTKKDNNSQPEVSGTPTVETPTVAEGEPNIYSPEAIPGEAITDSALKESLLKKTNKIIGKGDYEAFMFMGNTADYVNLSAGYKAAIALSDIERTAPTDDQWNKITDADLQKLASNLTKSSEYARGAAFVQGANGAWREEYKDLFGDDIQTPEGKFNMSAIGCPQGVYVSSFDGFLSLAGCGGVFFTHNRAYVYDYQQDSSYAYVYLAGGTVSTEPNVDGYWVKSSLDGGDMLSYETGDENSFTINASNYEQFTHYRLAFKKTDSGNYVFKTMTRI